MKSIFYFIFFLLFISGCAHWYSQDQETLGIRVSANEDALSRKCRRVGSVVGISYWDSELAMIDLRREASKVSATHVVVTKADHGFWKQAFAGDAYSCAE